MGKHPAALVRLVDRFSQDHRVFLSPDFKEEQLRAESLNPFFKSLGWDGANKAVLARALFLAVAIAAMAALCLNGCQPPIGPSTPSLDGASMAWPFQPYRITVVSSDHGGLSVAYSVQWDDGTPESWSPFYASGQQVVFDHVYNDTGNCHVRVKAKDTDSAESKWAEPLAVHVAYGPLSPPLRPVGPQVCTTGYKYTYSVSSSNPYRDTVRLQFQWDGIEGSWSDPVPCWSQYNEDHEFYSPHQHVLRARMTSPNWWEPSPWSESLAVMVVGSIIGGRPESFHLASYQDSAVLLSWTPSSGQPDAYRLFFRDVATGTFAMVGETDSLHIVHWPNGATGDYYVCAAYGESLFSSDTMTTRPVHTAELTLYEVNTDPSQCAYGWNRNSGRASVFAMTDSANCASVDFYVSDLRIGTGDPLNIVTPNKADTIDSGAIGIVPRAAWRTNGFSNPLLNAQNPVPAYQPPPNTNYFIYTQVSAQPCYVGFCTLDGEERHYALIQINELAASEGTAKIETWFQMVPGLTLVKHE